MGRHILIVRSYELGSIAKYVNGYIAKCDGDEWGVVAEKIARNLAWEFEDYQS